MNPPRRIEDYLAALRQALRVRPALMERILCEVEDHLREGVAWEEQCGAPPEEAERRAIERFGPVEEVARWWSEVYTRENGGPQMWQRFTERARRIVFFAQEEAARLGENFVGTEHLLLGLAREDDSVAARILTGRLGIALASIREAIEKQVTRGTGNLGQDMQLTPRAKQMIDLAYEEARRLNNNYIGTEHLLLGLILEKEGLGGRVLRELGADLERSRAAVDAMQEEGEALKVERAALVSQVQSGFYGAVARVIPLSPAVQALIRVLTTMDPGQLADAIVSYLKLEGADRQELAPEKPPEERLQKLAALLQRGDVAFQFPVGGSSGATAAEGENSRPQSGEDPEAIVRIAHTIIQQAIQESAAVIRVEPPSDSVTVFFQIEGVDEQKMNLPKAIRHRLIARYKEMADMEVDAKGGPQQGRIAISHAGRDFDLDVRCEASPDGERLAITIHEKS